MRAVLAALLLSSSLAFGAGPPFWRFPPTNCSTPSASCIFDNPTVTGKLTLSGTTGPQVDSTGTSPLEIRSRASGTSDGTIRLYGHNSQTSGYLLKIAEKAGTTAEDRLTIDHDGTLRLWPDGIWGSNLELFGGILQTNGGSDAPIKLFGGPATTAFAGRLLSVMRAVGAVQVFGIRADGTAQQAGVPTASLGACNGSAEGSRQYDTDVKAFKFCDGTAWRTELYVIPFDGSQDVGSLAAGECTNFTLPATGVVDADVLACDKPSSLSVGAWAICESGGDVIGWQVCNFTGGTYDPPSATYRARVLRP